MSEHFKEATVTVFMGGRFELPRCQTIGELRDVLKAWDNELAGWGDQGQELSECVMNREAVHVTLQKGIYP